MDLKNKRVLVTGADGFIGSHLCEKLLPNVKSLRALSLYNSFNNWGWLEDIDNLDEIEVVSGDVRDENLCRNITKDIDVIFHLAALIAIPYSYIAPSSYIDTNVKGTLNICQGALDNGCEKIIHTSTSEVYGTADYVPIDEKHQLKPQSPYSASKIGADSIAWSFFSSFNLPVATARPFNTFGPRQSARAVIPTIITQIASGMKEIKLGDLSPTRDMNYVENTCNGMIAIAKSDKTAGEVLNIGSGREISIENLVFMIRDLMDKDVKIIQDEKRIRPEKSEVFRLCCDNRKIMELTDFKEEFSLEEGIIKTIEWFSSSSNLKKYKPGIYNV